MVKVVITSADLKKTNSIEGTFPEEADAHFALFKVKDDDWLQFLKNGKSIHCSDIKIQRMFNSLMKSYDTRKKYYELNLNYRVFNGKAVTHKSFKGDAGKRLFYIESK